ncbi:MAG: ABC transporter permease [Anaerolineae bacterium]|nr:ABC transporter permease [Thermoflexus sp.]MDW8064360.1 ABC transporter permease [Anaerolineae bacterium]
MTPEWIFGLAGVLVAAAPLVIAVVGETLSERAGVVNLSLNGAMLLAAMVGFAAAVQTGSLELGFLAATMIGALMALVVAFASLTLRQSQVAVGLVLALLGRDLAYFLGSPFMNIPGPRVGPLPIPVLKDLPILGPLLFQQTPTVYISVLVVVAAWIWMFRTRPGLVLRCVGERPSAAFGRGVPVTRVRYGYAVLGGALVGFAGAAYILDFKGGWQGPISGMDGIGWIVLAITIFGGWHPVRGAFGVLLFALLQWLSLVVQPSLPGIPPQVFYVVPFPLMIFALLLTNLGNAEWVQMALSRLPESRRRLAFRILHSLRVSPPAGLGMAFKEE